MKIRGTNAIFLLATLCCVAVVVSLPHTASAQKKYYLTSKTYPANQVLKACASGYHMASVLELINPERLIYNYSVLYALYQGGDQGHGPPINVSGWVRSSNIPSLINASCEAGGLPWTDTSQSNNGAIATSTVFWDINDVATHAMAITNDFCDALRNVWCIQN